MPRLTPERWTRARALFEAVLELPAESRAARVHEAAADDAALAHEVLALLRAHESPTDIGVVDAGDLLEALEGLEAERSLEGQRIGPWQVDRRLGRGGMGDVFLAHRADGAYAGSVALKTIRLGMDTPELVARFEAERQILARLTHPNIARLLDGGVSPDGRPYLVMDYVLGAPITEYADALELPVARRLGLFLEVCDAVRFAHRNLIVHRDIKPSNVLVTEDGRPVLLDFGIAKLLDPEPAAAGITGTATRTQARLLTPEYASPEQHRGEPVTTASDVYMLGVVLRELLTGRRADEPRLTAPARRLRGDLDVIVQKATQHDPARRYGSVEPLAEDIRRHLAGLPIEARADSWAYRTRKFVVRHRSGVAAALLLLAALAAGVAAASWQAARAERNFADARALANALLFDVHDAIADLPGSTPARRLLVERALLYLDRLSGRAQRDTALRIELARAYIKTANVLGNPGNSNLGDRAGAEAAFAKAQAVLEGLGPARETRAAREVEWSLEYGLTSMQYWASRYDAARAHRERAAALAERLLAETPGDAEAHSRVASIAVLAGDIEFWGGTIDAALGHFRKAAAAAESAVAAAPKDPTLRLARAIAMTRLGDTLGWAERYDEAGAALRRATALHDELLREQPGNARIANSAIVARSRWASLLIARNDRQAALDVLGPAVVAGEDLLRTDPRNVAAQNNLALVYVNVGDVRRDLGEPDAARAAYEAALRLRRARLAADPTSPEQRRAVANSLAQLAELERSRNRFPAALEDYRQSIEALRALHRDVPDDPAVVRDLATWLVSAGLIERRTDPVGRGRALFREALPLWETLRRGGHLKPYDESSARAAVQGSRP